ncbi:MAG: M81 family metallopeptidase [Clostridia bacterium]|nr:M81 family metallopeptidase [Clostridia bacterium]
MNILIATFGQETNTFSPDRITATQFLPNGWIKAETIVDGFRGTGRYLGGAIRAYTQEENIKVG